MSGGNWDLPVGVRAEDLDWGAGDGDDMFTAHADDLLIADPRDVRRAETAPMVLTIMGADGTFSLGAMPEEKIDPGEEYRYTDEYHRLYYSKNPRDPRMLPPLTRRRHHLVREARDTAEENTGFAVTSGERNGVVGDRVRAAEASRQSHNTAAAAAAAAGAGAAGTTVTDTSSFPMDEQTAARALVKAYIDGFRAEWEYAKIKGNVHSFSKDQDGSRLVQRLLEKTENIVPIFNEVISDFDELATDVFGNYVLQKLFDVVPRAEDDVNAPAAIREGKLLARLTEKVRGQLVKLSCQTYGCRVMQKALENVRAADRVSLIHELDGRVAECVFDQNANHVVQKVVEVCPADAQFIIDAFIPDLGDLACHAYGCRVLQRTFEKCHDVPAVNVRTLMEAVLARVNEFTIHQYGNYVVQHAMLNAPDDLRHKFVMQLAPQLYALSCSKFASNVAERIVTTANEEERDEIIKQLSKPMSDAQRGNYLIQMMQDTYANYVVQRFFESVSPAQQERISGLVQPFVDTVNRSVYGRHLLRKMVANNILTNTFLLGHGIDVSSPEYGGKVHQSGQWNDRNNNNNNNNNGDRNNNHNHNRREANSNGMGGRKSNNTHSHSSGGGRNNGSQHANAHGSSNNNNNNNNGMQSNAQPGNPGMMMMQPTMQPTMVPQQFQQQQQQQPQQQYMAAPGQQQFAYGPAYGVAPQQQQNMPQQQQQPFMGGNGPNQVPPSSQYAPQMPMNNGQYNFSVYPGQPQNMPQQQQPQQQQGYAMQGYNAPQQQQQQQFRQDNAWASQAFMNGGYGGAAAPQQQQQPQQASYAMPQQVPQQPQQQQSMYHNDGGFLAGAAAPPRGRGGKDADSGRPTKRMNGDQFSQGRSMEKTNMAADGNNNSNGNSRRSNHAGQRSPQQSSF